MEWNLLLPPSKWLIAEHPLPLAIDRVVHCTIGKEEVILVMRIHAISSHRVLITVILAKLRNQALLNPSGVSLDRSLNSNSIWVAWLLRLATWTFWWFPALVLTWTTLTNSPDGDLGFGDRRVLSDALDGVAELVELGVAGGEGVRLPLPWTPLNSLSEIIILELLKTKTLLQVVLLLLGTALETIINIVNNIAQIAGAVLRHAMFDWHKVLPVIGYSLDWGGGGVIGPECAWGGGLRPCGHGAGVGAAGEDPWGLCGLGAGLVEWEFGVGGEADVVGDGVLEGEVLHVLRGQVLVWRRLSPVAVCE